MSDEMKAVKLTMKMELYNKLEKYKDENGNTSIAAACMQLITKALRADETNKVLIATLQGMTLDQMREQYSDGFEIVKQMAESLPPQK